MFSEILGLDSIICCFLFSSSQCCLLRSLYVVASSILVNNALIVSLQSFTVVLQVLNKDILDSNSLIIFLNYALPFLAHLDKFLYSRKIFSFSTRVFENDVFFKTLLHHIYCLSRYFYHYHRRLD